MMLAKQITAVLLIATLNAGCYADEVGVPDLTCYRCDTKQSSGMHYDADCDMDGYGGNDISGPYHACFTEVFTDGTGRVVRGRSGHHEDGACYEFQNHMYCACTSNNCNNDLCQDCFPPTTPHTTTTTTTTPAPPTEEPRFFCYSCSSDPNSQFPKYDPNCADYDYANNAERCDDCTSCYTHAYTDGRVSRGSTHEVGLSDCDVTSFHRFCYCHDSYCNVDQCDAC